MYEELISAVHILSDTPSCTKPCSACPADRFRRGEAGACDDGTMQAAADAIEALTAENTAKDAEIERLKGETIAGAHFKSWRDNVNALCRSYEVGRDRLQAEQDDDMKIIHDAKWSLLYKRASAISSCWPKDGNHEAD